MKKTIVLVLIALSILCGVSFAVKEVVLPQSLLLNSDKAVLVSAQYVWGETAGDSTCVVRYRVQTNDRAETYKDVFFTIQGADFTALVLGFGGTMETRLETSIWQDIQTRFELVP